MSFNSAEEEGWGYAPIPNLSFYDTTQRSRDVSGDRMSNLSENASSMGR